MLWPGCIYFELTSFTEGYFFDMIDMIKVDIEGVNHKEAIMSEKIQETGTNSDNQTGIEKALEKLSILFQCADEHCAPPQYLPLTPVRVQSASVYASKLGGVPYLPKEMEYPKVLEGYAKGKPLRLLAQLNFSALPHVEGFPQKGILQIFAGYDGDDSYGYDDVDQTYPNGFRIVYHETVLEDQTKLLTEEEMPQFSDIEAFQYPFTGEFLLEASTCGLSSARFVDDCFIEAAVDCYEQLFGDNVTAENVAKWWRALEEEPVLCEAVYAMRCPQSTEPGTQIGGYPFFTQGDPRAYDRSTRKYDVLLFQLNSGGTCGDEIMWGDCGIANFFISAADLAACDFSHVMYTWDCG